MDNRAQSWRTAELTTVCRSISRRVANLPLRSAGRFIHRSARRPNFRAATLLPATSVQHSSAHCSAWDYRHNIKPDLYRSAHVHFWHANSCGNYRLSRNQPFCRPDLATSSFERSLHRISVRAWNCGSHQSEKHESRFSARAVWPPLFAQLFEHFGLGTRLGHRAGPGIFCYGSSKTEIAAGNVVLDSWCHRNGTVNRFQASAFCVLPCLLGAAARASASRWPNRSG